MSKPKGKKMTKLADLNLGLDEIAGEISEKKQEVTEKATKRPQSHDDYLASVANSLVESVQAKKEKKPEPKLDNCANLSWIAIPETVEKECEVGGKLRTYKQQTGRVKVLELHDCSAEDFVDWMKHVYPPAEKLKEDDVKYYAKLDTRKQAFANIINFHTKLPVLFQKYGSVDELQGPSLKKNQEKEDKGE